MEHAKIIFTYFSLLILFLALFVTYKSFMGNVTFGYGLGDIAYLPILWVSTFAFLFSYLFNRKREKQLLITNIIFTIIFLWIFLKITILRGSEYPWNGEIFPLF